MATSQVCVSLQEYFWIFDLIKVKQLVLCWMLSFFCQMRKHGQKYGKCIKMQIILASFLKDLQTLPIFMEG